jgi:FK506-binding protein 2
MCRIIVHVCIIIASLNIITTTTVGIGGRYYNIRATTGRKTALLPVISALSSEHQHSIRNRMIAKNHPCGIGHWPSFCPSKYVARKCLRNKVIAYPHLATHCSCKNNDETESESISNRRAFVRTASTIITATAVSSLIERQTAGAEIIDATDIFADNDWSSTTARKSAQTGQSLNTGTQSNDVFAPTDEIKININRKALQQTYNNRLGIELVDIEFRTNLRVRVKSVHEGSYAASQTLHIQPDWIIVSINGRSVERTNAAGVRQYLIEAIQDPAIDDIVVVFRDPSMFQSQLRDMSIAATDNTIPTVTTQVGPSGDTTQRNKDGTVQSGRSVTTATTDQKITVQQLQKKSSVCTHGAEIDDLLEISYTGTVAETGQIFDGSAILINNQGIPGRGNDISLFFVLGKQPLGQFPPGWDVGLIGMCAGERRRLIIPPALAYGNKGLARRNIPPNSTLQYDITLISINGLAI